MTARLARTSACARASSATACSSFWWVPASVFDSASCRSFFFAGLNLVRLRGDALRLTLRDGRVLQLDPIGRVVERCLRGGDARLRLGDLRLIVGGIDLDQEIAGLDALKIMHSDGENLAGDPAREPRRLGLYVSIVRGLDDGVADPLISSQSRQRDESQRQQHGEQRNCKAAKHSARTGRRQRSLSIGRGESGRPARIALIQADLLMAPG